MKFKTKLLALAIAGAMPLQSMALEPAADLKDAITGGTVSGMLRLRYEGVDQETFAKDAAALTLRSSIGYETKPLNGFSLNVIAYNMAQLVDEFNDTKNGEALPVVADPEDTDFHNLYLQWANKEHQLRFGRQNIFLDNWRMVGDVRFRQNWQVFDGLTYVNTMIPNATIFYGYFDRYKTVTTKLIDIKSHQLNANYKLTKGTSATGYAYLTEFEQAPTTSTKTFGIRVNGREAINDALSALFTAEYAKQDDYQDASNIDADYYLLSAGIGVSGWDIRLNHEFLSGKDSSSSKPFQPHFGTNHLFQGWSDLFLSTPDAGIEDTFLSVAGKFKGAVIKAEYHLIKADNNFTSVNNSTGDEYGKEFDLGVYYTFKPNVIGSFEYAHFTEDDRQVGAGTNGRKPDTDKFWVTGIYKF